MSAWTQYIKILSWDHARGVLAPELVVWLEDADTLKIADCDVSDCDAVVRERVRFPVLVSIRWLDEESGLADWVHMSWPTEQTLK